jgi:hypothetical protein
MPTTYPLSTPALKRTPRRRSALPITVTELRDIAAPAMIGDRRI